MRRAAKRDKAEKAIVDALRACGCSVDFISGKGTPDLLVGINGHSVLMEVKGYAGQLTEDQIAWHRDWRGSPAVIVRSIDDALAVVERLRSGVRQL